MMHSSDRLREDRAYFQDLEFGAETAVLGLRNAVGHNDLIQGRCVDPFNGVTTEDSMGEQGIYISGTLFLQQFCSSCNCVGSIGQIVDEYSNFIRNLSHKHHCSILTVGNAGRSTFLGDMSVRKLEIYGECYLMNQCKVHIQPICNCRSPLRSSSIRTDDDRVFQIWNVRLNVLLQEELSI
jgi:hypothetical protein